MAQPYLLDATRVLDLFKNNTLTVEQYARSLLDRINERDSIVQAWAYLDPEFVLEQARALDQIPENERGPLHGLAIGIKDIANTRDMPTQFGSPIYTGHQSCFDSSAVAILRDAGALIFGKTTTTEFTVANSGPNTTNPHDPNRTPGGSSCGSAAAVADFQVTISLGAQTGGSVIRPASYTGVFTMKPTYNAISLEGQKAFAPTFDTIGFFARNIDDLQLLADMFAIKDDDESPKDIPPQSISVALIKTPMWTQAGPSTVAAIGKAAAILQNCGAQVEEVSFPRELSDAQALARIQTVITSAEAQRSFLREYRVDKAHLAPEICAMVENTANYTSEVTEALDTYAKMRAIINGLAKNYSVILTPSAVDEAPLGLGDMGSATFNTPWTGFHMPVINIPAFIGAHGMPVGVSLVAPRFRDQHLLRISKILGEALMAEGGWRI
ncbi:amidase signature domain-containing protein [Aspergillus egyptiacus]|nr:amidase signature domain-containing protein [Aspergillus egyptiacus]